MKNRFDRVSSLLLALVLTITLFSAPVYALNGERYSISNPTQHNTDISEKQKQIEDKYGIFIFYPTVTVDGIEAAAIQLETLETLETALSYVTPKLVLQVSTYYYKRNDKRLRFTYKFADLASTSEVTVGGFDPDRSLIELYIPRPGKGAVISGDAPLTVVHEFGHAVQCMIADQYGENKLTGEWTGLNGDYTYRSSNIQQNPSDTVFVSGYGATAFSEDFAETFAYSFVCNRTGMGFSNKLGTTDQPTALGKKVNKLYNLLNTYYPDCTDALSNYRKLYNVSSTLSYSGVSLSGSYLQFIGYSEPRYLPTTALEMFDLKESRYKWISNIGGWFAAREGKDNIVVFPGGNWGTTANTLS